MTEEKKKPGDEPYSLEELNNQFKSNINKKNKKNNKRVPAMILALLVLAALIALIIWKVGGSGSTEGSTEDPATVGGAANDQDPTAADGAADNDETAAADSMNIEETETYNESILSEEDQEKWTSTEPNGETIFIELKDIVYLDGRKAYIRLVNPIYSTYYYNITIYPEGEEDTILYQSEKIAPGTILEAVMLTAEPTEEQYQAVVKYQVYNEDGNELGTHPVSVEFTIDEQYK